MVKDSDLSYMNLCRYMLAEDEDTLYIAFMGTKQRRDLVANAAVLQVLFWPELENPSVRLFKTIMEVTLRLHNHFTKSKS